MEKLISSNLSRAVHYCRINHPAIWDAIQVAIGTTALFFTLIYLTPNQKYAEIEDEPIDIILPSSTNTAVLATR